jgi:hypothetical protein
VKKEKVSADEKFQNIDFDLFPALDALDKKDYGYFDKLTDEQKRKFVPYMLTHWMSQVKSNSGVQAYYVRSVDYHTNHHLFNEQVQKHPKLQWLMLCASSPQLGKQFHQWVPHISEKIGKLKEKAKEKDVQDYFSKIYPSSNPQDIKEYAKAFVALQHKKVYLSEQFPQMKHEDLNLLAELITDEDIQTYEKDRGN